MHLTRTKEEKISMVKEEKINMVMFYFSNLYYLPYPQTDVTVMYVSLMYCHKISD